MHGIVDIPRSNARVGRITGKDQCKNRLSSFNVSTQEPRSVPVKYVDDARGVAQTGDQCRK
jgi:hypothetical protein